MRNGFAALTLLLGACNVMTAEQSDHGRNDTASPAAATKNQGGGALEQAAIDSGAIVDPGAVDPAGLFQRVHEGGRDSLCLMPDKTGGYRFGMEANFGENQYCGGHGHAKRAGRTLVLNFAGGRCSIVAGYEGDRLTLPGVVDAACDSLCTDRGSLAGVSLPRLPGDQSVAMRVNGRDGIPLCSGG